jgi:hypothetical protein
MIIIVTVIPQGGDAPVQTAVGYQLLADILVTRRRPATLDRRNP